MILGCSPRTRGWSHSWSDLSRLAGLLPAHAGMVPIRGLRQVGRRAAPRARGDGPRDSRRLRARVHCSPRTRGWSQHRGDRCANPGLLPAHAGMVPRDPTRWSAVGSAPRARGDGPFDTGRAQHGITCSPRTRGWSPSARWPRRSRTLLPAHAGMVPSTSSPSTTMSAAPRARGDGPVVQGLWNGIQGCSPRTRGWSPPGLARDRCPGAAPRARGDGPAADVVVVPAVICSPRTRGWSRPGQPGHAHRGLLPAHAGMVPARTRRRVRRTPAPRARGDGPRPPAEVRAVTATVASTPSTTATMGHGSGVLTCAHRHSSSRSVRPPRPPPPHEPGPATGRHRQ